MLRRKILMLCLATIFPAGSATAYVTNQAADVVIGQPSMVTNTANNNGVGDYSLYRPIGVFKDDHNYYVVDSYNHRVLIYNSLVALNNNAAQVVIGQPDMLHSSPNQGGNVAGNTLNLPISIWSNNIKLFIADTFNHRVLIYNTIPSVNNAFADVVIGQPNSYSATANNGGVGANTLYWPFAVHSDGTKLYVADAGNNRVLIFNQVPVADNTLADVVVGQPNFTANSANTSGLGPNTLYFPTGVCRDVSGNRLFVADEYNNRVLIFNQVPTAPNASADFVIGQADMLHNSANQGHAADAGTLYSPHSVFCDNNRLAIADEYNNRVLIFSQIPNHNGEAANATIGQTNMAATGINQGNAAPRANTLYNPIASYCDGEQLIVADHVNNRVLIYYPPTPAPTQTITPTMSPSPTVSPFGLNRDQLVIYPQPGYDSVRIVFNFQAPGKVQFELFTVAGERALRGEYDPQVSGEYSLVEIPINELAAGIYFAKCRITDTQGVRTIYKKMAVGTNK